MSNHDDEQDESVGPTSNSFWDIGNYKRVLERMDGAPRLCDELQKMLLERAELHAQFERNLRAWKKKWTDNLEKSIEYGTTKLALKQILEEADGAADVHMDCREKLTAAICPSISGWKKEHYHKSKFNWRETKLAEDGFERSQKPWMKRVQRVSSRIRDYESLAF